MTMQLSVIERGLIDGWQRGLPLQPRPYREMADRLGVSEGQVLAALTRLTSEGVLSRIGVTVRPNTAGASTLAALSVPAERLEAVAAIVSAEPSVNHNYEREHALNLWFVVTARDRSAVDGTLVRLERATGGAILDLPLERPYVLDLGFAVQWEGQNSSAEAGGRPVQRAPTRMATAREHRVLLALAEGLALTQRPYAALGAAADLDEAAVIAALEGMIANGIIGRLGLIVRHRALGYRANAMAVWDIADGDVDRVGALLAAQPHVTLCYRRPRRLPAWPYNLFCMVHGRERTAVRAQVDELTHIAGDAARAHDVLFSRRCFKQRGANLAAA